MLVNSPGDVMRIAGLPTFLAICSGQLPMKDGFNQWIEDQYNHVYFKAMVQIATKMYIGDEVATDTLKQRFHLLGQQKYNPMTRNNDFLSVSKFHNKVMALLNKTSDIDAATVALQVPELDVLFYHGLLHRLQQKQDLTQLTVHAPSTTLGENLTRLQAMVEAAKLAEQDYNLIVSLSMGCDNRQPIWREPVFKQPNRKDILVTRGCVSFKHSLLNRTARDGSSTCSSCKDASSS